MVLRTNISYKVPVIRGNIPKVMTNQVNAKDYIGSYSKVVHRRYLFEALHIEMSLVICWSMF